MTSHPQELSVLGQAAVVYAQHGWLIFPCKPGRKEPATKRGLYAAARDAEGIAQYWTKYPEMNVAIRCGQETGIVVLDIDGEIGAESFAKMQRRFGKNALPPTFMVQTPRGGHHYYFAHPGPEIHCTVGWPGSGMDIRGDGGYVLAPPSMVGGVGSYERVNEDEFKGFSEMPAWLLEEIFKRQERAPKTIDTVQYEQLVQRGATEGNRNDQLVSLAGHLWSHGLTPGEVLGFVALINRERCTPPLPSDEVEKLVMSVQRMRRRG